MYMYHVYVHTVPQDLVVGKGRRVQLKEAEGFASTYYNIPSTIVQRVTVPHEGKVSKRKTTCSQFSTCTRTCTSYVLCTLYIQPSAQDMAEATTKQDESFMRVCTCMCRQFQASDFTVAYLYTYL